MEPDATPRPSTPPPAEWRALSRLRERVEDAAAEIEALRARNEALAERVAELEQNPEAAFALPGGGDAAALRARVQGFIAAIDDVLAVEPEVPDTAGAPQPDAAP